MPTKAGQANTVHYQHLKYNSLVEQCSLSIDFKFLIEKLYLITILFTFLSTSFLMFRVSFTSVCS